MLLTRHHLGGAKSSFWQMEKGSSVQQSRVLLPTLSVDIYLLSLCRQLGGSLGSLGRSTADPISEETTLTSSCTEGDCAGGGGSHKDAVVARGFIFGLEMLSSTAGDFIWGAGRRGVEWIPVSEERHCPTSTYPLPRRRHCQHKYSDYTYWDVL